MVRKYCREKIGKRCVVKTTSQEVFKKYTGVFAISSEGCVGYEVYRQGGIDPKSYFENIIHKTYFERKATFVKQPSTRERKLKMYEKVGILNVQRCKCLLYTLIHHFSCFG